MVMDFNNKEQFVLETLRYEKEVRQRLTVVNENIELNKFNKNIIIM